MTYLPRKILCGLLISLSLAGCNKDENENDKEPVSPLAAYKGSWIEEGAGLAVTIKQNSVTAYHYTRETCSVMGRADSLKAAEAFFTQVTSGANNENFSFIPSGGNEFDRKTLVNHLIPQACNHAPDPTVFNPEFIFEHAWHTFNDYYPFFSLRKVDWQQQWDLFRPMVTAETTQEELLTILADMLSPIDDGHVFLSVETDELEQGFSSEQPRGWQKTIMAGAKLYALESDDDLEPDDDLYDTVAQGIKTSFNEAIALYYGTEELQSSTSETSGDDSPIIYWGRLEGNIGYLQVNAMEFSEEDDIDLQLLTLKTQMDSILDSMGDTDGMIIDVRFNEGGYDQFALTLASYFTDQERLVFSKENYNLGNATERKEFFVTPNQGQNYTKPITLITGPNTGSAAEIFTLAMKVMPHVSVIGEPTQGILSDVLDFTLMDGWNLGLSYQVYYSAEDSIYEATGITPDKMVPVTSFTGTFAIGAMPAIYQALDDLGVDMSLSDSEFTARVNEAMTAAGIPGLTAAWIDDKQLLDTFAMGYANSEEKRPVTDLTPFTLGSVSKTFIGVSIMQMLEQGFIDTDTTFGDLSMPFVVNNPHNDANEITIIDLATHTSGILDTESYPCGYYIEATQENLFAGFIDDFSDCPEPVETNQSAFLQSLLDETGELYNEEGFSQLAPGESYIYSNVGAALAAEMLTVASGTDFETWTEENIFSPLGMNNTHWFNDRYSEDQTLPATRYTFVDEDIVPLPEYALATWGDGGLKATSTDLARYLLAIVQKGELDGQRIMQPESVELMLSALIDEPTLEGQQGVFWTRDNFMFGHNGGDPGTFSEMRYDQYHNMGLVIMLNLTDEDDLDEEQAEEFSKQLDILTHLIYRRGLSLKQE